MVGERPLTGYGQDTFWYTFNSGWKALEDGYRQAGMLAAKAKLESFDSPHNIYVFYLVNGGIPALLLYLAVLVFSLKDGFISLLKKPAAAAPVCAVLLYAVHSFFSFSLCLVSPMFWAMLGLCGAHMDELAEGSK